MIKRVLISFTLSLLSSLPVLASTTQLTITATVVDVLRISLENNQVSNDVISSGGGEEIVFDTDYSAVNGGSSMVDSVKVVKKDNTLVSGGSGNIRDTLYIAGSNQNEGAIKVKVCVTGGKKADISFKQESEGKMEVLYSKYNASWAVGTDISKGHPVLSKNPVILAGAGGFVHGDSLENNESIMLDLAAKFVSNDLKTLKSSTITFIATLAV